MQGHLGPPFLSNLKKEKKRKKKIVCSHASWAICHQRQSKQTTKPESLALCMAGVP